MIRKLFQKLFGRRRSPVAKRRGRVHNLAEVRKRYQVHCDTDLLS